MDVLFIPKGIICLWYGSLASIPSGWTLCDGTDDTPDLRDSFVVGAGTTYDPHDWGGQTIHRHPFTGDGHFHRLLVPGGDIQLGTDIDNDTDVTAVSGMTNFTSSLPPYYALCYIMKT